MPHLPVVGVKHLKLREISVERRDVFHPSAPECADFENVACRTCDLHMHEQQCERMEEAYELQQGLEGSMSLVEGTTRFLPDQSIVQNNQEIREGHWCKGLDDPHLEPCQQLPGLCEISGTSFKHPLKFLVKGGHLRGRHSGN